MGLVLSRKVGEAIVMPELGITIVVAEIKGGNAPKVKIWIDAPPAVRVFRPEALAKRPAAAASVQDSVFRIQSADVSGLGSQVSGLRS